ncbi:MAG: hypothetical protein RMK57_05575 [Bryobacterales bacterium]|nr:hypothetical protein [Bryobacteraceae bacterium]MDW8353983.1 hypothetical protein [Bryobacterales bacterium]
MSKVDLRFKLVRPLDEAIWERIAAAHGIYGILRVLPRAEAGELEVVYDASRLTAEEVEAELCRLGIPIERLATTAQP